MNEDYKSYFYSKIKKQIQTAHKYLNDYYKQHGLYTELCADGGWLSIQCSYRGQFYKVQVYPIQSVAGIDDKALIDELNSKIKIVADIYNLLKTRGD